MTAAPTPRDGERELLKADLKVHYDAAILLGEIGGNDVEYIIDLASDVALIHQRTAVAQRVAEAVGPLEKRLKWVEEPVREDDTAQKLSERLRRLLLDRAEEESMIESLVKPHLTPQELNGDKFGAHGPVEQVGSVVLKYAALEAENRALRADKERLDWLGSILTASIHQHCDYYEEAGISGRRPNTEGRVDLFTIESQHITNAPSLRAAIDAARADAARKEQP